MATEDEYNFPPELPDISHIPNYPDYSLKRRGECEKKEGMKRKNEESYVCPLCPFESTDEKELQHHSNEHLDNEEHDKLENDEPAAKRKRIGGIKSNVPLLEEYVEYQGFPVKFKRVILTGMVDTAKKNLYELRAGKIRIKWNKSCFNEWLYKNVKDSKEYTKETLKKRVHKVEKEADKFIMTKKESSATGIGKMKKNIDPKLHSERKETFIEPTTEEEKEMADLGSTFAHLKKEIDETPIKPKLKQVNPLMEAKAKQLNEMLEEPEENDEEVVEEEGNMDGKKKIMKGTLKGMPYDMFEKSQQHRLKSVQDFYEKRNQQKKDPTKKANNESNDPLENAVMDLCKSAQESCTIKNQDQYRQQAFSPYMPYGYPYPGLMGAPLPLMQPMGMPFQPMFSSPMGMAPPNMFRPPMRFQPPDDPEHKKTAKSAAEGFSTERTPSQDRISVSGVAGRSSSEHAPAKARTSLTGKGGPSYERDSETIRDSVIEETELSSDGFAPQKRRTSVIGQIRQPSDQSPHAKSSPAEGRKSVISASMESSELAPADISSTVGGRKFKLHPATASQSTDGPPTMAYGDPNLYSHMTQQSQDGQMVYSDMAHGQAGGSYPQMSAQRMPPEMMASPMAQQQMAQQQMAQQQMAALMAQQQMAQQQMVQQQMASLMAQQQGYPQMFQRSPFPMMSGPPNSSQPNRMGPGPSKNGENQKPSSTKTSDVFNYDGDY